MSRVSPIPPPIMATSNFTGDPPAAGPLARVSEEPVGGVYSYINRAVPTRLNVLVF